MAKKKSSSKELSIKTKDNLDSSQKGKSKSISELKLSLLKPDIPKSKRYLVLGVILVIILLIFLFGTKIYLLFNLLVGNDVLVRVNLDKENLFLNHGQEETINVKTDIVANPFCSVYCNYTFKDISSNEIFESNSFSLKTISPINKEFKLKAPLFGEGQELYRFEIYCNSKKTLLCDTSEEIKSRTILITLNYNLTSEEQGLKDNLRTSIIQGSNSQNHVATNLPYYTQAILSLNNSPDMLIFINKSKSVQTLLLNLESKLIDSLNLWRSQDYGASESKIEELSVLSDSLNKSFNGFSIEFSFYLSNYNSQINRTKSLNKNILSLIPMNLTEDNANNLSYLISNYNNFTIIFDNMSFGLREQYISNLEKETQDLSASINSNNLNHTNPISTNLTNFNKTFIEITLINSNYSLKLEEPIETCCLFGKCQPCCNQSCSNDKTKFPILFVHGHKFNKDISADTNFHSFEALQKAFESNGYLNSGFVFSSNGIPGIWSKINSPQTMSTSYYFEILNDPKGETILESKKDSIDTYAIRLNEVVKEIKKRTGKEKVILVTHSMGGLVARKYLQIFGEGDVEKLVLIMVPNHGVNKKILGYCNFFGSEVECSNMDENSVFINKLNNAETPRIPVYNIIGLGCNMDGQPGDGIVTNSTAFLSWAENYYIKGTCDDLRFTYLHTDITLPDKYPQLVTMINEILNQSA